MVFHTCNGRQRFMLIKPGGHIALQDQLIDAKGDGPGPAQSQGQRQAVRLLIIGTHESQVLQHQAQTKRRRRPVQVHAQIHGRAQAAVAGNHTAKNFEARTCIKVGRQAPGHGGIEH